MNILNLTQHPATPEQAFAGVIDLAGDELAALKKWLTFDTIPTTAEIRGRALLLAQAAAGDSRTITSLHDMRITRVMIGGAPFLMGALEEALREYDIAPLYAFSTRVVEESIQPDGSVTKTAVFRHRGFVQV